jgi:hypothetical protein
VALEVVEMEATHQTRQQVEQRTLAVAVAVGMVLAQAELRALLAVQVS